ncbi:MAG: sigma-70 family RNA polymerase sigma factor [Firmicutes bacterium]|nr:sigma-70 family RNA polymerase sigma factor [Bacillota bacterium]
MNDNEKKAKKIIQEWGELKKVNDLKLAEINMLNKFIVNGNNSITLAKGEIERIENEISERLESHRKLGQLFSSFSEDEQKLIHLRYLKGCSWVSVARQMYMSERQVFNIHKKLLGKMCAISDTDLKKT